MHKTMMLDCNFASSVMQYAMLQYLKKSRNHQGPSGSSEKTEHILAAAISHLSFCRGCSCCLHSPIYAHAGLGQDPDDLRKSWKLQKCFYKLLVQQCP